MQEKMQEMFEKDTVNLRAEIEKYLTHWKWFLISGTIGLLLAVVYAKSQVNIFESKATLLIEEEGGAASELEAFQDLSSLGFGGANNVLDQVAVMNSRALLVETIEKLNLNFEVYQQNGLKRVEQFEKNPIKYQVLSDPKLFYELDTLIDITILDKYQFNYEVEGVGEQKTARFGEKIQIGTHVFLLTPQHLENQELENQEYEIEFLKLENVIDKYKENLSISNEDDETNVISLSLKSSVKEKAQLVLNTMVDLYNLMAIEDKNEVAYKTNEFIEDRLESIKEELNQIDKQEEIYKKEQQITDLPSQGQIFVEGKIENELELFKRVTELRMVKFMIEDIQNQKNQFKLLPSSIGVEGNVQISASVANYNQLLLERNRLLRNSSLSNPIIQNLNIELLNLRKNVQQSLGNTQDQLEIAINALKVKGKDFNDKISIMPKQVREYRSILRKQEIIANLYTYLLQKREENKITMAVTSADTKIIDTAYSGVLPIAPKKSIIALAGLIFGLFIPFGVIYLRDLLDTKFHSRAELEKMVSIPILGDIPFDTSEDKVIIKSGSRTAVAEAFRLLRTNLDFILSGVQTKSKVVFVTSTISGEGKTFVSVNTASSIALTGKKVLLVGMDLRAPKLTQYLGLPNRSGVSNYLIGQEDDIVDLVYSLPGFENLDILSSGIVPPNPAELLLNPRLNKMFEELRVRYDYIVVDTAPVNLVTDTLMMSHHADMFVYVARANYLDKRMLEFSQKLYQEKRLSNMAMLINGMDHKRVYGYGTYGYGGYEYTEDEEQKNFFQKLFNL